MVAEGKGGLNHICFEVEDIDEALAELKAKGIPLIDEVPRIGHAGARIAFIDPKATENCLIELAELPREHHKSVAESRHGVAERSRP
jgi:methylmalonyl-CoA/ethylmalonyl-CoA epimerase